MKTWSFCSKKRPVDLYSCQYLLGNATEGLYSFVVCQCGSVPLLDTLGQLYCIYGLTSRAKQVRENAKANWSWGSRVEMMGVDKRTVWGLFATIQRSYILVRGGLCIAEVSPLGQA